MPRRRNRAGVVNTSPRSASTSPEAPISQQDFKELKETVQNIFDRLDIIERIFLFVDIEQINHVVSKYNFDPSSTCKAGVDRTLTRSKQEVFSAPDTLLVPCIPEETEDNSLQKSLSACVYSSGACGNFLSSGVRQDVQDLADIVATSRKRVHLLDSASSGIDASIDNVSTADDVRQCIWEPPLLDEDEQKSTCSTWDLCSTRDGFDVEPDIQPELFQKFMKQALRPQWKTPQNTIRETQHTAHHNTIVKKQQQQDDDIAMIFADMPESRCSPHASLITQGGASIQKPQNQEKRLQSSGTTHQSIPR